MSAHKHTRGFVTKLRAFTLALLLMFSAASSSQAVQAQVPTAEVRLSTNIVSTKSLQMGERELLHSGHLANDPGEFGTQKTRDAQNNDAEDPASEATDWSLWPIFWVALGSLLLGAVIFLSRRRLV